MALNSPTALNLCDSIDCKITHIYAQFMRFLKSSIERKWDMWGYNTDILRYWACTMGIYRPTGVFNGASD